jgi:hypothetical protein
MTTTTVREKPILFSGPMVRAILDGKKTQTRRVVKPQPAPGELIKKTKASMIPDAAHLADDLFDAGVRLDLPPHCPYGQPGDRLWVREAWTPDHADFYPHFRTCYRADGGFEYERNERGEVYSSESKRWYPFRWRPSIHMPRWASRLTLEITNVRVERLQEISEADAQAEGVEPGCLTCGENCIDRGGCGWCRPAYRDSFAYLWMELNGRDSWDANPWVWVIEFRRLDQ